MSSKDRTGKRYGHLVAVGTSGQNKRYQWNWLCKCDCGNNVVVFGGNLNSGHTTSCGCKKGLHKHGENKVGNRTPEYQALAGILQRCLNPKSNSYRLYGAKGVRVCQEWNSMEKFPAFLACVGRRPSPKHSIDRWPDKAGNYEPGNVRWATWEEQNGNTKRNVYVTYLGETLCVRAMARKHGIDPTTFRYRLTHGWTVEEAVQK